MMRDLQEPKNLYGQQIKGDYFQKHDKCLYWSCIKRGYCNRHSYIFSKNETKKENMEIAAGRGESTH